MSACRESVFWLIPRVPGRDHPGAQGLLEGGWPRFLGWEAAENPALGSRLLEAPPFCRPPPGQCWTGALRREEPGQWDPPSPGQASPSLRNPGPAPPLQPGCPLRPLTPCPAPVPGLWVVHLSLWDLDQCQLARGVVNERRHGPLERPGAHVGGHVAASSLSLGRNQNILEGGGQRTVMSSRTLHRGPGPLGEPPDVLWAWDGHCDFRELLRGAPQDLQLLPSSKSLRNCHPHSEGRAETAQMAGCWGKLGRSSVESCSRGLCSRGP